MEKEARSFLGRFVKEFHAALEDNSPLPVSPLSQKVLLEELHGESLELGLRLLAARGAPVGLSSLLCQAALSQLLQNDLTPFYCSQKAEANQEDDQQEVLLQSAGVQRLFLNKLIDVALAWHQHFPKLPASPSRFIYCSVHATKNTRRKMEDKHLALAEFNHLFGIQDGVERGYYAVFDGHGGVDAATYAATHLHVALSKQEMLQNDAATAFKTAFKLIDDMFKAKAKRERLRSGTTGVAVLIQDEELTVSWLGDSQAILVKKGHVVTLMDPHKPDRETLGPWFPNEMQHLLSSDKRTLDHCATDQFFFSLAEDEKQRIEDLGGCITFMGCWRVNGTYAVSRAIGDFDQKPYVSGEADCSVTKLSGDEDYILLACDGFFDVVKPSEVPHLVLDALQQSCDAGVTGETLQEQSEQSVGLGVAAQLVGHAKAAGSSDNITVILVFLRPPEQLLAQDSTTGTVQATPDSTSQDALQ